MDLDLGSEGPLVVHLHQRPDLARAVTARDLTRLSTLQAELRRVFEAGAAGRDAEVVSRLNDLLQRHPIRPRISGHDAESYHLHVSDRGAPVADVLAAEYLFGLALVVTELGPDRFGICGAGDCNDVFVDLSPNLSRRFCGDKCATRTNVAAYRARRKASAAAG